MGRLYSYCLRFDSGAAPNPFWGVCTLAICKPAIRRTAQVGDWVVGTGSKHSHIGDMSGKLVYAMKITSKMTMAEYDEFTKTQLPNKIPDWSNGDLRRRLGDSIYDFTTSPPNVRRGVHTIRNRQKDLSGEFVLLSEHFFYFGDKPIPLPKYVKALVKQGPGHRSRSNDRLLEPFFAWLVSLNLINNTLYGNPQFRKFKESFPEIDPAKGRCLSASCSNLSKLCC